MPSNAAISVAGTGGSGDLDGFGVSKGREAGTPGVASNPREAKREKRAVWEAYHEARRREDVPLVEDFPLAPEEETLEFRDLNMTLMFRAIHAWEHWRGNKDLTLGDIIHRTIEDGFARGAFDDIPLPVVRDD